MKVKGKVVIYLNGFEGSKKGEVRVSASAGIVSTDVNGNKHMAFLPVLFSNDLKEVLLFEDIKKGDKVSFLFDVYDSWLTAYEGKNGGVVQLFINDGEIVEQEEKKTEKKPTKKSYRK